MNSLRTFWHVPLIMPGWELEAREQVQRYGRQLTTQQIDERQGDSGVISSHVPYIQTVAMCPHENRQI